LQFLIGVVVDDPVLLVRDGLVRLSARGCPPERDEQPAGATARGLQGLEHLGTCMIGETS
jgi:hypothetical protein